LAAAATSPGSDLDDIKMEDIASADTVGVLPHCSVVAFATCKLAWYNAENKLLLESTPHGIGGDVQIKPKGTARLLIPITIPLEVRDKASRLVVIIDNKELERVYYYRPFLPDFPAGFGRVEATFELNTRSATRIDP